MLSKGLKKSLARIKSTGQFPAGEREIAPKRLGSDAHRGCREFKPSHVCVAPWMLDGEDSGRIQALRTALLMLLYLLPKLYLGTHLAARFYFARRMGGVIGWLRI